MGNIDVEYPWNDDFRSEAVSKQTRQDDTRIDGLAMQRNAHKEAAIVAVPRETPLLPLLEQPTNLQRFPDAGAMRLYHANRTSTSSGTLGYEIGL